MAKGQLFLSRQALVENYNVTHVDPEKGKIWVEYTNKSGNRICAVHTASLSFKYYKHSDKIKGIYLKTHLVDYKTKKSYNISFHKIVYAWFKGFVGGDDKRVVDHIDTNSLNNSVNNLRLITVKENCNNRRIYKSFKRGEVEKLTTRQIRRKIETRIKKAQREQELKQNIDNRC